MAWVLLSAMVVRHPRFTSGLVVAAGFALWVVAMVTWDDPPRSPKALAYVLSCLGSGTMILGGLCLSLFPSSGERLGQGGEVGPSVAARPLGPAIAVRLHATRTLPECCTCCGDPGVSWRIGQLVDPKRPLSAGRIALSMAGISLPSGGVEVRSYLCEACHRHARKRILLRFATLVLPFAIGGPLWIYLAFTRPGALPWGLLALLVAWLIVATWLQQPSRGRRASTAASHPELGFEILGLEGGTLHLDCWSPAFVHALIEFDPDLRLDLEALEAAEAHAARPLPQA